MAIKFENYFKRWLQIFYPREISTSLEEKNRQLMKLIHGPEAMLDDTLDENNSNNENSMPNGGQSLQQAQSGENSNGLDSNAANPNESRLLFDFSNSKEMLLHGGPGRKTKTKSGQRQIHPRASVCNKTNIIRASSQNENKHRL